MTKGHSTGMGQQACEWIEACKGLFLEKRCWVEKVTCAQLLSCCSNVTAIVVRTGRGILHRFILYLTGPFNSGVAYYNVFRILVAGRHDNSFIYWFF